MTEAAGPWNTQLLRDNDGEYFCRVVLASDGIRFTPEGRSYYRRSGSSSVSYVGRSNKKLESLFLSMRLHVGYLLSLENSARTRSACVRYLQTWLQSFYPERPDIVQEAEQLATDLGGQLHVPRLRWKYAWIQKIFGWRLAKRAQLVLPGCKENLLKFWDKALFCLENRNRDSKRSKA